MAMLTCPDVNRLPDIARGLLSAEEIESVAQHLEQCPRCAEQIESVQLDTELLAALRRVPGPIAVEPNMQAMMDRLEKLPESPDDWATRVSGLSSTDHGQKAMTDPAEYGAFLSPPDAADELGRLGSYRLLKVLGQGGMGMVFHAEDTVLSRPVALKLIKPALAQSASYRQRFLREAKAAASVRHDHVVTIYQAGEQGGVVYLAMELLHGETLEDRVKREGKLPIPEVLRLGRQIAEGLAAAHAKGLIHRDVKPGNIWLEARPEGGEPRTEGKADLLAPHASLLAPRAKLLDFGLARAVEGNAQLTSAGDIVGTPAYMSPEQANGEAATERSDLFSLGSVLYRICTGEVPFKGEKPLQVLRAVAHDQPPAPQNLNPKVPAGLSDLVLALLAKEPANRPASAREVVERIAAIERVPEQAALRRARGSRKMLLAVAVALLALLPIGIWLGRTIIRIGTNQGMLVVEVDDPNVEIRIRQNRVLVFDQTRKKEFVLSAAQGEIEVVEKDGIHLLTKRFTLTQGEKTTVKVTLEELGEGRNAAIPLQQWTTVASMETARLAPIVAVVDGKIYVAGGFGEHKDDIDTMEVFDPVTRKWAIRASMPRTDAGSPSRHNAVTGVIVGKIYVAGGRRCHGLRNAVEQSTGTLLIYDPQRDRWDFGPEMPLPCGNPAGGVIDGMLYVCGEANDGKRYLQVYDPASQKWKQLGPPEQARSDYSATVIKQKLYVVGGHDGNGRFFGEVEVYDPAKNEWTTLPAVAPGRSYLGVAAVNDRLWILGGYSSQGWHANMEVYDPALNRLTPFPRMTEARQHAVAVVVGRTVYLLGGSVNVEAYRLP
jgi:serine/threonine protein kinase